MNKQETFDTVVNHLRQQGKKSLDDIGNCKYRSKDGCKCAAGCLIPDDKYRPHLEGQSLFALGTHTLVANLIEELGHDVQLVSDLQCCHDNVPVDEWEYRFQRIAKDHNLTYTGV